ncbi:MAG: TonB-dependent receptor, partial [Pacificimonas sp.]
EELQPFYQPFNFNPFNIYQTPLEQFRIYGSANYEINDNAEVFAEALFSKSSTSTIIAPSGSFGNVLTFPLSNPFLPDGIRNQICGRDTDSTTPGVQRLFTQEECDNASVALSPDDDDFRTFDLVTARRFIELGTRNNEYQTTLFQISGGVRGNIFENLDYQISGAYGESENRSRQSGNGTLTRLLQSAFSTSEDECLDSSNGCVPIDLFGPQGSITQDVADFLDVGNQSATFTTLGQVSAFITGDVGITSPISEEPISVVLGTEYRDYSAGTSSDLLSQTPGEVLGNGAANPDSSGGYDVKEAFGELIVPLVSARPGFEELTLQLGGRVSDYSSTGTEYTYKIGGVYAPVPSLTIRGNYQRVTRAPNIGELFSPATTGLDNFSTDPCAGAGPVGNATLTAICLAQIPGDGSAFIGNIQVDPAGQVNVTQGGNPDLDAEDADTWTVGAVFQPDFIRGLSITADYYNIKVEGAITSPTPGDVFAACFGPGFESGSFDIDGASAASAACTSIRRNPATGNLFGSVATTPGLPLVLSNLGTIETDGIDLNVNYARDFGFAGLNLNFFGNWTNSSKFQATPTSINRECVGFYSTNCASIQPEFSFTQRTTLSFDDFDVSLLWRFIDAVEVEPEVAGNFQPEFESIDAKHYFDLTMRASVVENLDLIFAVQNLFDKDPPLVGSNIGSTAYNSGNTFPSTYDPLGRRYSATAKLRF